MVERKIYIERIEKFPSVITNATHGLSDQQLDISPGEGKWTIRQIIHHIADANLNAYMRMKLIATEEKPILKPFNQDQWAVLADGKNGSITSSLQLIQALHERWVQFMQALPKTAWNREGVHLERGIETLEENLIKYSEHGEKHIQQITSIREKMNF
jgi:hypothetical protein